MVKDINNKKEFPLGEDKIGYVRLVQFGEKTSDELEAALRKLKAQGMQALILDLRGNPGGLLDQAVDVCSKFLPRRQLIVSTEGQNAGQDSKTFYATGRGDELNGMPMVVLVNFNSASASEIVAGCLQDLKRAVIMGEKTFGKGSVQSIIPAAGRLGAAADDGEVLHAQPQGHSRRGHHAGLRRAHVRRRGMRADAEAAPAEHRHAEREGAGRDQERPRRATGTRAWTCCKRHADLHPSLDRKARKWPAKTEKVAATANDRRDGRQRHDFAGHRNFLR